MPDCMTFPDTVEEFMEQYKVVDTEQVYTNGTEFVPIYRMRQWFQHEPERKKGKWIKLDMHAHLADHKCTACGQECYVPTCMGEPMYTYCPNCGADMRGDNDDQSK